MAEYIDKQAFNDAIREAVRKYPNTFYNGLEVARQIAHDMNAADVQPVRHGRWLEVKGFTGVEAFGYKEECVDGFVCSICGGEVDVSEGHFRYCPNCGARLDLEEDT